jgi:predicted ATPase
MADVGQHSTAVNLRFEPQNTESVVEIESLIKAIEQKIALASSKTEEFEHT